MTSKIRIHFGEIEVEFEGSEDFLKQELPLLLKAIATLHQSKPPKPSTHSTASSTAANTGDHSTISVSSCAQKLKVSSGPELVMAAALKLTLTGNESFSKTHLRSAMKEASAYYKDSYRTNLDAGLKTLIKAGRIHHGGGTNYSLPITEREKLASVLNAQ